jgi:hypothetical protein
MKTSRTPLKLKLSKKTVIRLQNGLDAKLAGGTGTNPSDQCQSKGQTGCQSDLRNCTTATQRNGFTIFFTMTGQ